MVNGSADVRVALVVVQSQGEGEGVSSKVL